MNAGKILAGLLIWIGCWSCSTTEHDYLVYVGTYTGEGSEGIYVYRFHSKDGHLTPIGLAARTTNPSYFVIDSTQTFLYSVQETGNFQGTPSGAVSVYRINRETGILTLMQETSTEGGAPCHLSFDERGRFLMVANYVGGNAMIFPVEKNGMLGSPTARIQHNGSSINTERQDAAHAHAIQATPGNRSVAIADLGIDQVIVYPFDAGNGTLDSMGAQVLAMPPGSGPRHFTYAPDGTALYVLNELTSTVGVFARESSPEQYTSIQTVPLLGPDFKGTNTSAELVLDPAGRYLYASNRGDESLVAFRLESDGRLTFVGRFETHGRGPRHFEIDPTGRWLMVANQHSHQLTLFSIDREGQLDLLWSDKQIQSPVCIRFVPVD